MTLTASPCGLQLRRSSWLGRLVRTGSRRWLGAGRTTGRGCSATPCRRRANQDARRIRRLGAEMARNEHACASTRSSRSRPSCPPVPGRPMLAAAKQARGADTAPTGCVPCPGSPVSSTIHQPPSLKSIAGATHCATRRSICSWPMPSPPRTDAQTGASIAWLLAPDARPSAPRPCIPAAPSALRSTRAERRDDPDPEAAHRCAMDRSLIDPVNSGGERGWPGSVGFGPNVRRRP